MGAKQMKCLSSSSPAHTPKEEYIIAKSEDSGELVGNHTEQPQSLEDVVKSSATEPSPGPEHAGKEESSTWEEQLCAQQEQLEKEMQETRKMVSRLQALLLHGSLPEDEQTSTLSFGESTSSEQQLILIRSRLDQSMEESLDLKRELLRYKQEARNLQAIKDALQQRMSVQEDSVLQLKQELLRSSMAREELEGHNVELERKLNERNRFLSEYKKEIGQKDRLLQQQQAKLDDALHRINGSYHRVTKTRANLTHFGNNYINNRNKNSFNINTSSTVFQHRMVSHVILHLKKEFAQFLLNVCILCSLVLSECVHQGDELHLVRDALHSLRDSFSVHDPQHHMLDTLEQGLASLVDRLHTTESKKRQERKGSTRSPGRKANHTDRESWPSSSKIAHSHSSPVLSAAASTKVLYYTDRSLTPFLVNIPKRLGEVTLQDFKAAVDRHGCFRYHFKSLDPEFGTVKEEVFQDDAVIPGWEGKIVAWVEEDRGEGR
ncbi:dixin-A [Rhinichthys klamathensis goyatoka]|uniref:dixin-A n=1 Tax=Rhinichthys klamathensis goyatoka TaxID=3034132 RepID=UPI0024B57C1C|nr:dixin-A [Rhinichthys klamathensis goyatoka]